MDENTEKAQQQREIPYPVTNERRLGVDNQWMTNVGSMNPILSTRRKSLQLFWATFPSDQHNVTFPLMPSFCNLWPSNETLGTKVFSWQFSVGEWWKERRCARSFFLSSPSFHFHFTFFVFVSLFNTHPVGICLVVIIIVAHKTGGTVCGFAVKEAGQGKGELCSQNHRTV